MVYLIIPIHKLHKFDQSVESIFLVFCFQMKKKYPDFYLLIIVFTGQLNDVPSWANTKRIANFLFPKKCSPFGSIQIHKINTFVCIISKCWQVQLEPIGWIVLDNNSKRKLTNDPSHCPKFATKQNALFSTPSPWAWKVTQKILYWYWSYPVFTRSSHRNLHLKR